jgi:hypothetical protein
MRSPDAHAGPFRSLGDAVRGLAEEFDHDTALIGQHDNYAAIAVDIADRAAVSRRPDLPLWLIVLLIRDPLDGWSSWNTRSSTRWLPYPDDQNLGVWIKNARKPRTAGGSLRGGGIRRRVSITLHGAEVAVTWDVPRPTA